MAKKNARAKLKRLLQEADGEKARAVGRKAKGMGVAAKARVGTFVAGQRALRTPEARVEQAQAARERLAAKQVQEEELATKRQAELQARKDVREAREKRRAIEREIREERYGPQIEVARKFGRRALEAAKGLGKGVAEVGKLAAGTETIEATRQRAGRTVEVGRRRGFVVGPLREFAREPRREPVLRHRQETPSRFEVGRHAVERERSREDIRTAAEQEGVSRKEMFELEIEMDFPDIEL